MPVDDPRLNLLLDEYMRDRKDGVSLRSVHNRVTGVQREFEKERLDNRERFARIETKLEATEKREAREDLADAMADANGTGRHHIQPQMFTPAFGVQMPADLRPPQPVHKRDSGFWASVRGKLKRSLGHAVGAAIGAAAFGIVSMLASRGCQPAQKVESAATAPPKVEPATQAVDAGR